MSSFAGRNRSGVFVRCYDLQPDGSRFLFRDRASIARESVSRMDLVLNWTSTLSAAK